VPFLIEPIGLPDDAIAGPHKLLRDLRRYVNRRRGDAILLGEVNLPPDDLRTFFGDENGDELHMAFNFPANQAMYLALARGDARPLKRVLETLPDIPTECQWANFVRNHDELTLDKLSEEERSEVFEAFGPEDKYQLFGRGLRRRLPTMLDGDQQRIRMIYSLAFSLPGTPVLFYGEEIGMAENLDIEGRMSVRAPMQWSHDAHGGFTTADEPCRPVIDSDRWGPEKINVGHQRRDDQSLLNWMERLIRRRRESPEIGWGDATILDVNDAAVLAHRCDWDGNTLVAVHSFASEATSVSVPLGDVEAAVDLFADEELQPDSDGAIKVDLEPYAHRWYRLRHRGQPLSP
jgi:glycosidase